MTFVLDASVSLAWLLPDETTADLTGLLEQAGRTGAVVPTIWLHEVANGLRSACRRGRIEAGQVRSALYELTQLRIETDTAGNGVIGSTILTLAETFTLTIYDAAYLELAQRRNLPLATLDRDLRQAARSLRLTTIPGDPP